MPKTVLITVALRVDDDIDDDHVNEMISECDYNFTHDGVELDTEIMSVDSVED